MSASKTVVYYNIQASDELVFLSPKEHFTYQEASAMKLCTALTFEKNHKFIINFIVSDFQTKLPDVFAFVAVLLEHGFVPEGHNGPFKPERGATHFWSRPYDPEAVAAKSARF